MFDHSEFKRIAFSENASITAHCCSKMAVVSALYVSIPEENELGPAPAGYLSFGQPPPELGTGLNSFCSVQSTPGKLVLFPSYTWHGTEPFSEGERLTVAFDVIPR